MIVSKRLEVALPLWPLARQARIRNSRTAVTLLTRRFETTGAQVARYPAKISYPQLLGFSRACRSTANSSTSAASAGSTDQSSSFAVAHHAVPLPLEVTCHRPRRRRLAMQIHATSSRRRVNVPQRETRCWFQFHLYRCCCPSPRRAQCTIVLASCSITATPQWPCGVKMDALPDHHRSVLDCTDLVCHELFERRVPSHGAHTAGSIC